MQKPKRARLPACIARWEFRKCALAALSLRHPQMVEGLDAVKGVPLDEDPIVVATGRRSRGLPAADIVGCPLRRRSS